MAFNNLIPFFFPLILFSFWALLGYSVLAIFRTQRTILQNMLLAPGIGLSITLLPIFWLNRAGIPVGHFATILTLILFIGSFLILFLKRPILSFRYCIYFLVFVLALCLTGRPLLEFGFDWVSFSNDDMANYCLAALRFLQHGYSELPNIDELNSHKNYSLYYWYMHGPGMVRSGSDLILAWISGITNLSPIEIFMPTILALHLTLISTTGAFVLQSKRYRSAALATCIVMSFSALVSLGTLYQLIAQVGGLSLLITLSVLLFQPYKIKSHFNNLKQAILISLIGSAFLIYYPELLPFIVIAFALYLMIKLVSGWRPTRSFFLIVSIAFIFCLIALNTYVKNILFFLYTQSKAGTLKTNFIIFPYYLLPGGLANIWGLAALNEYYYSMAFGIKIIFGFILSIIAVICMFWQTFKKAMPVAIMLFAMALLFVFLGVRQNDFGLFKLAMYIQPFLLGTVVVSGFDILDRTRWKIMLVLFLIAINITTQQTYVEISRGEKNIGFTEIVHGSKSKINSELKKLAHTIPDGRPILSDESNAIIAKIEAIHGQHKPITFLPQNYLKYFEELSPEHSAKSPAQFELNQLIFQFKNQKNEWITNPFLLDPTIPQSIKNGILLVYAPKQSLFNKLTFPEIKKDFHALQVETLQNHLVFIHSDLGKGQYPFTTSNKIAFYHMENDYIYPNQFLYSLNRYLLMLVLNPSLDARLVLNLSSTALKGVPLPPASVIGETTTPLSLVGYGSGRIFSDPIQPKIINNLPFLMLDMGVDPTQFPNPKVGLQRWYGKDIRIDTRHLNTFARDISLITEKEYQALVPPTFLSQFPNDLKNHALEYSGMYEDGWISSSAFFTFSEPSSDYQLKIKGFIPRIDHPFTTELTIEIDGEKIAAESVTNGTINIQIPVTPSNHRRKVVLHFKDAQILPYGDDRHVAAKIEWIGFEKLA